MKSFIGLVLFSVLVLVVCCSASEVPTEDGVYVLSKDNFDAFIQAEPFTVVEFYAPWCGHCKKLTPEWAKAAKQLANADPAVKLAKVDATVESELGNRFGVKGYPTIKVFRSGEASDYDGPREANGIVKWVKSKSGPSSVSLDSEEAAEAFLKKSVDQPAVLYFNQNQDPELQKPINTISASFQETFRFAHTNNPKVAEKFGAKVDSPSLIVAQASRYTSSKLETPHSTLSLSSSSTAEEIASFLIKKGLPLAGVLNEDNLKVYRQRGIPILKLFLDADWEKNHKNINYYLNRLRMVAKKFEDKISFVVNSFKDSVNELKDLGYGNDAGSVVILDNVGKKYVKPDWKFSVENLENMVHDFLAGKLEPFVKSGPIPENNEDEDVKVVVAKNFDSIVMDDTKDVLLEAYAPWCGHCKSLEPKYKELGKEMKKYSKTLTIAKVDATANDLPAQYMAKGYPTIFFAPANRKDQPIKYNGDREVKDFVEFIKKNAFFPLEENAAAPASDEAAAPPPKKDEL